MVLRTECFENSRRMRHKTRQDCSEYERAQTAGDRAIEISDEIVVLQNDLIMAHSAKEKIAIRIQIDAKIIERKNIYNEKKLLWKSCDKKFEMEYVIK